jgi:hypothetical protein
VTAVSRAPYHLDPSELEIDVVVDDDKVIPVTFEISKERTHGIPGAIHVRLRLYHHDIGAAHRTLARNGIERPFPNSQPMSPGKLIHNLETHVVAMTGI